MSAGRIKFDEFELDCDRYQLLRSGISVKLEKIPMELLILLVSKNGHLATRQEIVERLWGNDVFVDTEHGINTAVRKVRQVLGDDPEQPRFVQTVTGKGYRFIAAATRSGNGTIEIQSPDVVDGGEASVPSSELLAKSSSATLPQVELDRASGFRRNRMVGLASVLLILLIGAGALGWRTRSLERARAAQIHSIAVLPFDNLSGDPAQDFFADGITDELITMLAKNTSLRVVSRTSVMQYKRVRRPLREIARELGVDGIVEGSMERTADKVHLTVQCIQASTDAHLWAESYDRNLRDAASLPAEVAKAIAEEVNSRPRQTGPHRYVSPEAHDAYLWGRYYWFADEPQKSSEYFQKAIVLQPDYAEAWSGLADSLMVMAVDGVTLPQEVMSRGETAARTALALNDQVVATHMSIAAAYLFGHWDFEQAERESARALELDPNYSDAHHLHAYVLEALGRKNEALQEQKKATELDPLTRPWAMGFLLIRLHQFDAALDDTRRRLEARPDQVGLHQVLADIYRYKGMDKESAEETERVLAIVGDNDGAASVHRAFARGGLKAVLELRLKRITAESGKHYVSPYELAFFYARLQRREDTLRCLEEAYRQRSPWMLFMQHEPDFDFLHSDPRYQALVKGIGVPPMIAPSVQ